MIIEYVFSGQKEGELSGPLRFAEQWPVACCDWWTHGVDNDPESVPTFTARGPCLEMDFTKRGIPSSGSGVQ